MYHNWEKNETSWSVLVQGPQNWFLENWFKHLKSSQVWSLSLNQTWRTLNSQCFSYGSKLTKTDSILFKQCGQGEAFRPRRDAHWPGSHAPLPCLPISFTATRQARAHGRLLPGLASQPQSRCGGRTAPRAAHAAWAAPTGLATPWSRAKPRANTPPYPFDAWTPRAEWRRAPWPLNPVPNPLLGLCRPRVVVVRHGRHWCRPTELASTTSRLPSNWSNARTALASPLSNPQCPRPRRPSQTPLPGSKLPTANSRSPGRTTSGVKFRDPDRILGFAASSGSCGAQRSTLPTPEFADRRLARRRFTHVFTTVHRPAPACFLVPSGREPAGWARAVREHDAVSSADPRAREPLVPPSRATARSPVCFTRLAQGWRWDFPKEPPVLLH